MSKMLHSRKFFKGISFENMEKRLGSKRFRAETAWLALGAMIIIYTATFSYFVVQKHWQFRTYAWDLGIFNQSFWTTVNCGRFFYSTVELIISPSGSFFGTHFSPILFVILPWYTLYQAPESLLIMQSFIISLGIIPLYKLATCISKYRIVGLVFSLAYLLSPLIQGVNWYDFHVQSFLPMFFFSILYFLETRSWKFYFLFVILALTCEEHSALIVFFIGLLATIQYRHNLSSALQARRFKDPALLTTILTFVLSVSWYTLAAWIRSSLFSLNPDFVSTFKASSNWSVLGAPDPMYIPIYIIQYPYRAALAFSYDATWKVSYCLLLFAPLAFTSFVKARYLLPTIPWFVYSLSSNFRPYYVIFFQYPAYIMPFIFGAAVYGINNRDEVQLKTMKKLLTVILVTSLIAFALTSPFSPFVTLSTSEGVQPMSQHEELLHEVLDYVPPQASIITINNIFPHLSSRADAYVVPSISPVYAGKSLQCEEFTNDTLQKVDYALVDIKSDQLATRIVFSLMRNHPEFKVYVSADGIVLFRKGFNEATTVLAPYNVTYDYKNLNLYSGEVVKAQNSSSDYVLHFKATSGYSPLFWYDPGSLLYPGTYNMTVRLKISGENGTCAMDFCAENGSKLLRTETFSSNASDPNAEWISRTFNITLSTPLTDFEVRAVSLPGNVDIYLDCIELMQIGAS